MTDPAKPDRDVFISYASEDRDTVAKPLALLLTALGIRVWFDQFDLKIGDSLRRKIDEGLARCRHGIVILSPSFFGKHYTNRELNGLAQREVDGTNVILPVWVGVDENQVRQFSAPLADRIAGRWEDGIDTVVIKLAQVIKPEALRALEKRQLTVLPRLTTGRDIVDLISGSHFIYQHYDDPSDDTEVDLVGGSSKNWRIGLIFGPSQMFQIRCERPCASARPLHNWSPRVGPFTGPR